MALLALPSVAQAGAVFSFKFGTVSPGLNPPFADGTFNSPAGIATDAAGNIYVADGSQSRVQKFDSSGHFLSAFGSHGNGDGQFQGSPFAIAIDPAGNIYVTDLIGRVVKFDSNGNYLSQFGSGQLTFPRGVSLDASGNVYVTSGDHVSKFDSSGAFVTSFGSGHLTSAYGNAVDPSGNIWVADRSGGHVVEFDPAGNFVTQINYFPTRPSDVAFDSAGSLYVAIESASRIDKYDASGDFVWTVGGGGNSQDGQFRSPFGLTVDASGRVIVSDTGNVRVQVLTQQTLTKTFYVRQNGTDASDCATVATACATVQQALVFHRQTAGDDTHVIDIGPGTYNENIDASNSLDNHLLIRGTLGADGSRETTVHSLGLGAGATGNGVDGFTQGWAVIAGTCGGTQVTLRDLNIDTDDGDASTGGDPPEAVALRSSKLDNVSATTRGTTQNLAGVEACGTTSIAKSELTSMGDTAGVTGSNLTMSDSSVTTDGGSAVSTTGSISLSRVKAALPSDATNPVVASTGGGAFSADSSLFTGGAGGLLLQDDRGADPAWSVSNSTIDAGAPGVADAGAYSIKASSGDFGNVSVNSSLLVEAPEFNDFGFATCSYSDFPSPSAGEFWDVSGCDPTAPGNSTTDPADQFVGGSPYSWRLKADAPAVDTGDPTVSGAKDLAGSDRVVVGRASNCPDAVVDKGAYERASVACFSPTITNAASADVDLGNPVSDTATLTGGSPSPTGTITFRLYGPDDTDCSGTPVYTGQPIVVSGGNASSGDFTPTDVGEYRWTAEYSGDADNNPVTSQCGAAGSIVTVMPPSVPVVSFPGPTIANSASPAVGAALAAGHGVWTNAPTSYSYRWVRCDADGSSNCTDISGATSSVYTPVEADTGDTLKVRVVATNAGGDSDSADSAPTGVVTLPVSSSTSPPTITGGGSAAVGTKLRLTAGTWVPSPSSFVFQWVRCDADGTSNCNDIAGKTQATYTPVEADAGHKLKVRVIAHNASGDSTPAMSAPSSTVVLPVPSNLTAPSIIGGTSAQVGTGLRVNTGSWAPVGDPYTFQWVRCDANGTSNCNDITGATTYKYTPADADIDHTLKVRLIGHNATGDSAPAMTAPTSTVVLPVPSNAIAPSIVGGASPAAGGKLRANTGSWVPSPTSYAFQWVRCDSDGTSHCNDITGATSYKYTAVEADAAHTLKLRITAHNATGDGTPALSAPSSVVALPVPVNSTAPSIIGGTSPRVGTKLRTNTGSWVPSASSFAFQWVRCDADGTSHCNDIAGAIAYAYTPVADDAGHTLKVRVTAHNATGDSTPVTTALTGQVVLTVPANVVAPSIIGAASPKVGTKLRTNTGSWVPSPTTYAFQWIRCDADGTTNCNDITGAIAYTYTPVADDAGHTLKVRVTAHNATGDSTPDTTDPTSVVTAPGV